MISNMGDGDLVDPAVHGIDDAEATISDAPVEGESGFVPPSEDDAPERASEVDDLTDGIDRPDIDVSDVDVVGLLAEREEFKALAQRVQADYDNFRRQSAARSQAEAERASGRLAEALLPVLDAAEAAYVNHPDEVGPLLNQMLTELKRQGLETLDLDGQPFDPEVAEAVVHEPAGGGEPIVAEVLRSGYRWKGRTLRAAMVKTTD